MGKPIRIDFGTQSNPGRFGPETGPRHINAYVEEIVEGQPQGPIYATAGLDLFSTVSDGGACRGGIVLGSTLIAVSGTKLVSMDGTGTATDIGGIPGSSNVFAARNAKASTPQISIVVDGSAFVLEDGDLSLIDDADLQPPNSVTFLDQRVIYTHANGQLSYSDIDDVSSIGGLSFATAEGAPDGLVRGLGHKLGVFLFGSDSTEVWASTSSTDNPFQRLSGGFMPRGTNSPHTPQSVGDVVLWVGNDDCQYQSTGNGLQDISHGPVTRAIKGTEDRASIVGSVYYENEHTFYSMSGPDWTWVRNMRTGRWFERQSKGLTRWRAQFAFQLGTRTILGDRTLPKFYEINTATYNENGDDMVWTVQSPPVHAFPNRICVDRFYADFVTGVGLNSSDTDLSIPKVSLRWSDDGGKSWSRPQLRSLGAQGQHQVRVVWDALGVTGRPGRIWELSASPAVARGFRYAAIEGDPVGT